MSDLKARILARVSDDLTEIEAALADNLDPYLDLVGEVARHILFSGGKRLRPLLSVLSARLCGRDGGFEKTFAVIFEYLHAATLLHDDLVDGATLRRGKPAAHTRWGNETAVLVGDFLLARSLSIAARTREPRVIEVVAEITENMSQGEIDQLARIGRVDLSEAEYLEVIARKTAVLFRGACSCGALVTHAGEKAFTALADYGYHLGLAFQMADDLLDYTTDTRALGKEVGADLREGKVTLPVIHALAAAGATDRERMTVMIGRPDFSESEFRELIALLDRHGGIAYTAEQARRHVAEAKTALGRAFTASGTREILEDIADYALVRKH